MHTVYSATARRTLLDEGRSHTMPAGTIAKRVAAIDARVIANRPLCLAHVAIELSLAAFPPSEPGQFLQLRCAGFDRGASACDRLAT